MNFDFCNFLKRNHFPHINPDGEAPIPVPIPSLPPPSGEAPGEGEGGAGAEAPYPIAVRNNTSTEYNIGFEGWSLSGEPWYRFYGDPAAPLSSIVLAVNIPPDSDLIHYVTVSNTDVPQELQTRCKLIIGNRRSFYVTEILNAHDCRQGF
jgi:hypothetical protein